MATMILGFGIGALAGVLLREEYYFPTPEKVKQAVAIYEENCRRIEAAGGNSTAKPPAASPSRVQ